MGVIDNNYSIRLLAQFEHEEAILRSLLNGCVMPEDSGELLEKLLQAPESKQRRLIEKTLQRSLGMGHNAAGDISHYVISWGQIPRVETLRMARQPRGFNLLQQSTRRVEHNSVYEPETIRSNEQAHPLFVKVVESVMQAYQKLLDDVEARAFAETGDEKQASNARKDLRQDAMIFTPLLLKTNIGICGSARGFWQYIAEGAQERMPGVCKQLSAELRAMLEEASPELFKDWKSNYGLHETYPTGSDFLALENEPLERLIAELGSTREAVCLGIMNPFEGLPWREIRERVREDDPAMMGNLIQYKAQVLTRINMNPSIMHEMIRQRTVDQSYEPFVKAAERADRSFTVPRALEENGYGDVVVEQSSKLTQLYFDLVEMGIPKEDALGVLPHSLEIYALMTIDGWNLFHVSEKRLCGAAKPGMRKMWGAVRDSILQQDKLLKGAMLPQGMYYRGCTEPPLYNACQSMDDVTTCPSPDKCKLRTVF